MIRPVLVVTHAGPATERARQLYGGYDDTEVVELTGPRSAVGVGGRRVVVAVDIADDTTIAAVAARLRGVPVMVDTGDLVFELERSRGVRSRLGLALVWAGERTALACATHVIVRGTAHAAFLSKPVTFAPDLAPEGAGPRSGDRIRRELGLDGFVLGVVGSLNRAPRLGLVYGWDVVEALVHTDSSIAALIVGDGPGRKELEERATRLGVAARCRFVGAVPPQDVAEWIGAMDVAVTTQTNDRVGTVRTTGKLPLYLACGCPVLATDVGEAHRLLAPLGWTIPYEGVVDHGYPIRLAAAAEGLRARPEEVARRRAQALDLHREHFDADEVRTRVRSVITQLLQRRRP
jgi:glycosyltransferase involved in cell wall biosynthesis